MSPTRSALPTLRVVISMASAMALYGWAMPCAHAQPVTPVAAETAAPLVPYFAPDAQLLGSFGGKEGVFKLVSTFVDKMRADARIGPYFDKTKLSEFKKQLGDHLCQVLAGPCTYEGDSMKASHADLKINKGDSFRQVEILQASMDELQIPFSAQNKLLERLAPMYRDIITR